MICDFCPKEFDTLKSVKNHQRYCLTGTPMAVRLKIAEGKIGNRNPQWKEDVGYGALHMWVFRHTPKQNQCSDCTQPPRDLANISGEYKRDLSDWEWLCRRCHMIKDGRMENLKQFGRRDVKLR